METFIQTCDPTVWESLRWANVVAGISEVAFSVGILLILIASLRALLRDKQSDKASIGLVAVLIVASMVIIVYGTVRVLTADAFAWREYLRLVGGGH